MRKMALGEPEVHWVGPGLGNQRTLDCDMTDSDIRDVLNCKLRSEKGAASVLVEELGLCQGDVFVDVAVVDRRLEGYEIKSDQDTLRRLERQRAVYSKVLASATLVLAEKHLRAARKVVPRWWGIFLALPLEDGSLKLTTIREPRSNPAVDPGALVQLLWRDEALNILRRLGKAKGVATKPRRAIWRRILEEFPVDELQKVVCDQIKRRGDWRSASTRTRCGDSYPPVSRRWDSPDHGASPDT